MEKIYYKTLKENLYHEKLENGLEVYLLKKDGFEKTYGLFSTNFGSINTTFKPIDSNEYLKVNDGIAHFLEHKMFDMKDGDASDKFASLGANTNAFTSSSRTAYLFSTTSNEDKCVELLLDLVQSLDITEQSVEKEKGIIVQEIKMYDDDPDWRVYFGSIASLYHNHPVAIDIAGDEKSVNDTTKDMLYTCYNTFYHPSNMMLFVVGNIEPEDMIKVIKDNQASKEFKKDVVIDNKVVDEPKDIRVKRKEDVMDVEMNKLLVSIKVNDILKDSKEKIKRELSVNIFLDYLFSKSSDLYNQWIKEGLINDTFSANFTQEKDYSFIHLGGDQDDYQKLEKTIMSFLDSIDDIQINEEDFQRIKRKNIGLFINMFNSPESIANLFSRYYFEGISAFEIVDVIPHITIEDIYNVKKLFNKEYASVYIVKKS